MFLVVFALLIAHNTEAESSIYAKPSFEDYPLTIGIPTNNPEVTIAFYSKLGFKASAGLYSELDIVRMEKEGTPYKLEIFHSRSSDAPTVAGGVSGMSFPVKDLPRSVEEFRSKGLRFNETQGKRDGVNYASLTDPNGISIKLFEP